ncbi:hypothetical protein [uncultured Faecalibaculum sp.]|uniref:hypothetical protein n=1 Tax=uncultured Faecalibaculum sp. TaxID=1729681 RepID=UPI00262683A7|nr:hypothetical protein [uncultured Faecalibaculum sp.]
MKVLVSVLENMPYVIIGALSWAIVSRWFNRSSRQKTITTDNPLKTKKQLSEQFKSACKRAGISQNAAIIGFMQDFIDKHPEQ